MFSPGEATRLQPAVTDAQPLQTWPSQAHDEVPHAARRLDSKAAKPSISHDMQDMAAWLLPSPSGGTVFHSYDMIGGYPALFSRGHIVGVVLRGFTAQHEALRARVHSIVGRRQKACDS